MTARMKSPSAGGGPSARSSPARRFDVPGTRSGGSQDAICVPARSSAGPSVTGPSFADASVTGPSFADASVTNASAAESSTDETAASPARDWPPHEAHADNATSKPNRKRENHFDTRTIDTVAAMVTLRQRCRRNQSATLMDGGRCRFEDAAGKSSEMQVLDWWLRDAVLQGSGRREPVGHVEQPPRAGLVRRSLASAVADSAIGAE